MWAAHTSLTIQRAQATLFAPQNVRMLQNLTVSRHDEIPYSLPQPDEGVVALASACFPELGEGERAWATGPFTQRPNLTTTLSSTRL